MNFALEYQWSHLGSSGMAVGRSLVKSHNFVTKMTKNGPPHLHFGMFLKVNELA